MQVRCGQCGHTFQIDPASAGAAVACPRCEHQIPLAAPPAAGGEEAGDDFARLAVENIARRLRVTCGACGKGLSVAVRRAGKRVRCPSCGKWVQIPARDESDEQALERWTQKDPKPQEPLTVAALPEEGPPEVSAAAPAAEEIEVREDADLGEADTDDVFVIGESVGREVEQPPPALDKLSQAVQPATAERSIRSRYQAVQRWRKRARQYNRRQRYLSILGLAVIGAVVAGGAWLYTTWNEQPLASRPSAPAPMPVVEKPVQAPPSPSAPANPSLPQPAAAQAPNDPAPAPVAAAIQVLEASRQLFASGGYYPAAPEAVYWKVRLSLRADKKPLRLEVPGDVEMLAGPQRLTCLGAVGQGGLIPPRSRTGQVSLAPGAPRELTLLFEAPRSLSPTGLSVRGLGEAALPPTPQPRPPASAAIIGNYLEKAPRNLRPLLEDPVMAALQKAPGQRLAVRPTESDSSFDLVILGVLSAEVQAVGKGLYSAVLRLGDSTLDCRLRLADSGNTLILYLSDQPFHQLTYVRQDSKANEE